MKPTKTPILTAIALAVAVVAAAPAANAGPTESGGGGPSFSDQRLARMTQRLGLSAEQQTQIRAILDEERKALELQRQETRQRIDAVLTEAQRARRDQLIEDRIDRRLERLARRLDLSADQTDQIRAVMKERIANPLLTRAEIRERISALLTDEQRKEFRSMLERRGRGL